MRFLGGLSLLWLFRARGWLHEYACVCVYTRASIYLLMDAMHGFNEAA